MAVATPTILPVPTCAATAVAVSYTHLDVYKRQVLDQVLLHQSIIGLETEAALNKLGVTPDVIIGCAGGGSNLGGLIAPFIKGKVDQTSKTKIIAVEPESCPSLTKGEFRYDFCDLAKITPLAMMYTLGHDFIPAPGHAGGLRFHGMSPIISKLYHDGYLDEARAISQLSLIHIYSRAM